jgi:O-methyltransferase involved in polyketide biosynthesis
MDRLRQIAIGFQQAKILLAAAELRLFDSLRDGSSAAVVAGELHADARAVEIVLDALAAMGLVEKRDGRYFTRPEFQPLLVEDGPSHFVAMLRHQNRLFRHWAFLEERLHGQPLPAGVDVKPSDADHEDFIRAMYAVSHRQADDVVSHIDLEGVRTVADLGGGPGHYLEAFVRRAPGIDAYLVDFAPTLAVAARVQQGRPAWSRVHGIEWDLYRDDAPASLPPLDLAFLSQVVHSDSPEANRACFRRLFAVVAPGGRLIVHERVVEPDRTAPLEAATFAVNMLVMTAGGRSYTAQEIAEWGTAVGFVHERDVRISDRSHLTVLRKPRA